MLPLVFYFLSRFAAVILFFNSGVLKLLEDFCEWSTDVEYIQVLILNIIYST